MGIIKNSYGMSTNINIKIRLPKRRGLSTARRVRRSVTRPLKFQTRFLLSTKPRLAA